ncbi:MAG: transmembrane 220 family protein [Bacteroidota bacterium]
MKIAAVVLGILFSLFAVVQANDPDPLMWITLYGLTAGMSFLYAIGKPARTVTLLIGLWGLGLALYFGFRVLTMGLPLFDEEARELYGGLIVGAWMLVVYFRSGKPSES